MGLEAIEYLSEKGNDLQFGARPVKRVIQRDVLNQLSKEILSGTITTDSIVLIDAFDGKLVFRNQSELVSWFVIASGSVAISLATSTLSEFWTLTGLLNNTSRERLMLFFEENAATHSMTKNNFKLE